MRQPRAQNANNGATGLKRSGAASPPSLVLFLLSPEYLLCPRLVLGFVGIWLSQFPANAVRQLEPGAEGVDLFLVAEVLLGVEESEQEFLLFPAERVVERIICRLDLMPQLGCSLRFDVKAPLQRDHVIPHIFMKQ